MIETMSDDELADALRASQERLRQLLNEEHKRGGAGGTREPATVGAMARQAALRALRTDQKSVLAFVAITVIMVGVALANAVKALVGP